MILWIYRHILNIIEWIWYIGWGIYGWVVSKMRTKE